MSNKNNVNIVRVSYKSKSNLLFFAWSIHQLFMSFIHHEFGFIVRAVSGGHVVLAMTNFLNKNFIFITNDNFKTSNIIQIYSFP